MAQSNSCRCRPRTLVTPVQAILLFLLVLDRNCILSDAAHGRRARTAKRPRSDDSSENKYDRSITTFSDDGRLLQVEYGLAASNRGETVACLDLDGLIKGGGVCFATVVATGDDVENGSPFAPPSAGGGGGGGGVGEEGNGGSVVEPVSAAASDVLPPPHAAFVEAREKVHRIDDHALLVPTGLSGDGRALASAVRLSCRRMRLAHGEAPTASEIARAAASMQHELTRTGGARPFGVTATVVAVDPIPAPLLVPSPISTGVGNGGGEAEMGEGRVQLYQSEPGGVLERYDYCAAGRGRGRAVEVLAKVREEGLELRRKHASHRATEEEEGVTEEDLLQAMIRGVARAALESSDERPLVLGSESERIRQSDGRRVDVWLVRSCPMRRGGAKMCVARHVDFTHVEEAARRLAAN